MRPCGPIRVRLTEDDRRFVVWLLREQVEHFQFMSERTDVQGVEEMEAFGPTGVRIRDLKRLRREAALDLLERLDYDGGYEDWVAWLRYEVEGPVMPPEPPPGPIPLGPIPS